MCVCVCVSKLVLARWCVYYTLASQKVLALGVHPAHHAHQVPNVGGDLALEECLVPTHDRRLEDVCLVRLMYH